MPMNKDEWHAPHLCHACQHIRSHIHKLVTTRCRVLCAQFIVEHDSEYNVVKWRLSLLRAPNSAGASVSSLPCSPRSFKFAKPDMDLGRNPSLFPTREMVCSLFRLPKLSGSALRRFP